MVAKVKSSSTIKIEYGIFMFLMIQKYTFFYYASKCRRIF